MRKTPFRSLLLAGLVSLGFAALGFVGGAAADQRDPTLPTLFKFLKSATRSDEAGAVEDKIWEIWSMTGNPKLDQLMVASSDAMGRGDYAAALNDLNEIVKAKPDFAEGWNKR